jgi:hypothetical protein
MNNCTKINLKYPHLKAIIKLPLGVKCAVTANKVTCCTTLTSESEIRSGGVKRWNVMYSARFVKCIYSCICVQDPRYASLLNSIKSSNKYLDNLQLGVY